MAGVVAAASSTVAERPASTSRIGSSKLEQRRVLSHKGIYLTISVVVLLALTVGAIFYSFLMLQLDSKGCRKIFMLPSYARIQSFDGSYTQFAEKYSLYLYREQKLDLTLEPNGVPVLFIPGNAGSYKQVRSIAAEAAHQYYDTVARKASFGDLGSRNLDFFTADFNEDFTAFHGHTLLDQAEYLNDAIEFILSLYASESSSYRAGSDAPLPRSVILVGHSMGGIVARTMLTLPNYRPDSVNTIITLSTPHAVPPATFDWDIVKIYEKINRYWRESFSDKLVGRNPLASVSLISIAGGKLDVVVPSDYSSISSLMPSTNGFTVFTSTIPEVWTSMDHLAIVWCDQCRKAIAKALLTVVDIREPTQTKYLTTRLQIFRNIFLTGLESSAEKSAPFSLVHDTLLKVPDSQTVFADRNRRVILRGLGKSTQPWAYLIPIPKDGNGETFFSILTDQKLELEGKDQRLDIFLCEQNLNSMETNQRKYTNVMDLSQKNAPSLSFPCTNSASDKVLLPASTKSTTFPYEGDSFAYLQYKLEELSRFDYIAIVDSYTSPEPGFVLAEIIDKKGSNFEIRPTISDIFQGGTYLKIPEKASGFVEVKLKDVSSSLMSYRLSLSSKECGHPPIFAPLIRQFINDPYESKYFPNVRNVEISFHGLAPFVPYTYMPGREDDRDLRLQIWLDPTCDAPQELRVSVDLFGSLGNLVVRYRTAVAALPVAVVAMILFIQFNIYDAEGVFITFGSALEIFIGRALPILITASVLLSFALYYLTPASTLSFIEPADQLTTSYRSENAAYRYIRHNNFFLGVVDSKMAYLGPMFFTMATGMCTAVYYISLSLLLTMAKLLDWIQEFDFSHSRARSRLSLVSRATRVIRENMNSPLVRSLTSSMKELFVVTYASVATFNSSILSGSRRLLTTSILLISVLAYVPYQFAYVVGFVVHISTCVKSLRRHSQQIVQGGQYSQNFINFAISVLMIMIWLLPINIPLLVVWIHNLSVHWNTPFSSHHNLLSIVPIIFLVERLTAGKMLPRNTGRAQMVSKILLVYWIIYACLNGILNAYWLHHIFNCFALWLLIMYVNDNGTSGVHFRRYFVGKMDKRP
ncbi:PGAP1-like protein-domain-containing protein [Limtongia smithiae]|uniref:PGAP1-like protein-domain-containing protein n=1 Tax=Limtongia smithiae TaxID=1125753 RepID=UPI0034CD76F8